MCCRAFTDEQTNVKINDRSSGQLDPLTEKRYKRLIKRSSGESDEERKRSECSIVPWGDSYTILRSIG